MNGFGIVLMCMFGVLILGNVIGAIAEIKDGIRSRRVIYTIVFTIGFLLTWIRF